MWRYDCCLGAAMSRWVFVLMMVLLTSVCAYGQSRKENYDLQERCGRSAAEMFDKDFPKDDRKGLEVFENNYNVRLNKCFMLEENTLITRDQNKTYTSKLLTLIEVHGN